jgi:UDPglucose 6-dehydrogenase
MVALMNKMAEARRTPTTPASRPPSTSPEEQAVIHVYDPKVKKHQMLTDLEYLETRDQKMNEEHLVFETDPYEAVKDAHAVAVITEWDEFATKDREKIYGVMRKLAFVFDGRNILDRIMLKNTGFENSAIGKQ